MTDDHLPSPSSSDPSGVPSTDGMSEAELDALLADAASLSSEIVADVGAPDDAPDTAAPDSATEPLANVEPDGQACSASPPDKDSGNLDAQLADMADLLDATAGEIGSDLPAFAGDGQKPGVVGTPSAGLEGTSGNASTELAEPALESLGGQLDQAADLAGDNREGQSSLDDCPSDQRHGPSRSVTGRLSPVAFAACKQGATLLEVLDKPVAKVPEGARHIIGWIALATLGTALFVLLMSFL